MVSMYSMGGYGGYGSYGAYGQQMGGGNIPAQLKARHGYEFDYRERPKVAPAREEIIPKAQPKPASKFIQFLRAIF